ncbi:MAG TPA: ABC transporter ATP-binding protein [Candidatus Saccharimonadales bacterium]|nr:ABC transporter ATP-binding protein [Candidatus Saccharimonadales bacterium]
MTVAGPDDAILTCVNVSRFFGGVRAVDQCSLTVQRGSITGLIGPNGAGKSTLLATIGGAISPSSGTIVFDGRDVTHAPVHVRAGQGLIRTFQLGSEFPRLTVLENMMVACQEDPGSTLLGSLLRRRRWKAYERERLAEARGLLVEFQLDKLQNEYAGNLSGGQKRLLELARAVMTKPRLLLLDEPTVGINPLLRKRVLDILLGMRSSGVTCVVVEHALDVVEQLCDSVVVMVAGTVLRRGTMQEIQRDEHVIAAYLG